MQFKAWSSHSPLQRGLVLCGILITEGNLRPAHLVPVDPTDIVRQLTVAAVRRESGGPLDAAIFVRADEDRIPGAAIPKRIATFPITEDR
jgi:hypothetical protein